MTSWTPGDPALGLWSTADGEATLRVLAQSGFDFIVLDLQHGARPSSSLPGALELVQSHGATALVRVQWNRPEYIMFALDSGADGVIVPMVEDEQQAADAVAAARYPLTGSRSWGPIRARRSSPMDEDGPLVFVMIETRQGLENLESIAAVPGLAGIYIGPNDLALSMGLGRATFRESSVLEAAFDRILAVCRTRGLVAGFHANDHAVSLTMIERGYSMITVVTEVTLLTSALAGVAESVGRGDGGSQGIT